MPILIDIMKNKVLGPPLRRARREGFREGFHKGYDKGFRQGERGVVLRMAEHRFGPVPPATRKRIEALSDAQLRRAEVRLLEARVIEDLFAN